MSNRQTIINLLQKQTVLTVEEMMDDTGWTETKVRDTLSDLKKIDAVFFERDDVTRKAMYRLKDGFKTKLCVKPKPAVGKNAGSKDAGSAVGSSDIVAGPPLAGNAVSAPPKPDKKPVAACADVKAIQKDMEQEVRLTMAGKTIIDFCEWLAGKAKVRCPMNLYECKAIVTDLMQANEANADLEAMALAQAMTIKDQQAEIENHLANCADLSIRIALLESNTELPLSSNPVRYIVTDCYTIAKSESEANDFAIKLAKEAEVDTPVMVLQSHKARELRINWRDA